ncbi:RNA polymerase sigma factor [Marinactinospora rubrisoli]|uniref:RNA polymerase sigma factor n=1 Tax=Marinactinospora rubrisoli TaxID=2715399 RepID=A0ABW2KGX2_9ACTN
MTRDEAPDADAHGEFTRFFERHYDDVRRYAWRRVGPDRADDVAAETFAVAWRRRAKVPEDDPLPWLYAAARNIVLASYREERRRGEVLSSFGGAWEGAVPVHDASGPVAERAAALAVLSRLKPNERELVLLVAWEGLDVRAAARVLGCTAATARVRLHRARRRITRLMDAESATAGSARSDIIAMGGL